MKLKTIDNSTGNVALLGLFGLHCTETTFLFDVYFMTRNNLSWIYMQWKWTLEAEVAVDQEVDQVNPELLKVSLGEDPSECEC